MAAIKLTDQFGLTADAQPAPTSALLKYAKQLTSLKLDSLDLSKVGGLTLDQPALTALSTGVTFADPISLGGGAATLTVSAGASGSIKLITDASALPGHDDAPPIAAGECYVQFAIDASASVAAATTAGALSFGVTPSTQIHLASCSRFKTAGITLLQAVQQTVGFFAVTLKSDDLTSLAPGQITQASVKGKLALSASANLLAVTNPLASATLPAPLPTVSVSAGGSVTVGASFTVETEYEVVARKLDSGVVRLSWFKKKGSSVTVSVSAAEGVSAGVGDSDLVSQLIAAVSGDPKADADELKADGVPAAQIAAIESAIKGAARRKIEISVEAAFTASAADSALFLYQIDPAQLTDDSRSALDQALLGNVAALHASLPGIVCVRSILDDIHKREIDFHVNLIGVLNYRSIATFVLEGKTLYEADTGALVMSDTATAERIQTTQINFGADANKLRKVLAESFLITAAYQSAGQGISLPSLRCSQNYFALDASTSTSEMAVKLRTGVALALLSNAEAAVPAGVSNFGRTVVTISTDYDAARAQTLFLDASGAPFPVDAYEYAGRNAIQALVRPGDPDDARLQPASDDQLWKQMKSAGQPGIPAFFRGVPAPVIGAIVADYSTIRWWADAMSQAAQQLAKVRQWLSRNAGAPTDDPTFQKLRKDLAACLQSVTKHTSDEFGQPWGLLAMYQLAGPSTPATFLISGPQLVLTKRRALTAAP